MMVSTYTKINQKKKGESNCAKTWQWCPPEPRNNQNKWGGGGGRAKAPPLLKLGNGAHLRLEEEKPNKGRRWGAQASFLLKLGHGALETTKRMKKRGASSLSAKSW
jgi:hypothetical protein